MAKEERYKLFYLVSDQHKMIDLGVSKEKIQRISQAIRDRLGKVEICRDYTVYSYQNLELTVYPDGSSFCHQVSRLPYPLDKTYSSILGLESIRKKIANDIFPSRYTYDSVIDTVDVIFPWTKEVEIILRLRIEEGDHHTDPAPSVEELYEVQSKNDIWVEIMVKSLDVQRDVYECIEFLERERKV